MNARTPTCRHPFGFFQLNVNPHKQKSTRLTMHVSVQKKNTHIEQRPVVCTHIDACAVWLDGIKQLSKSPS